MRGAKEWFQPGGVLYLTFLYPNKTYLQISEGGIGDGGSVDELKTLVES